MATRRNEPASSLDRLSRAPVFFEPNRVSRTYRGGRLLAAMCGRVEDDGNRPEEWIASTVRARVDAPSRKSEGLSVVEGTGVLFEELLRLRRTALLGDRQDLGVLVKFIDSSTRLPAQVHPDKSFARRHFGSSSGKTEMWLVLAVRPAANLFIGFREGVTRRALAEAVDASESDSSALVSLLNEVPARPGEAWLIPGRLAHAIGAGCLILEVQEPTDFTIRPEARIGERRLSDFERYAGLDRESALDCFDLDRPQGTRALRECLLTPAGFAVASRGCSAQRILDRTGFPDFGMNRYRLDSGARFGPVERPSILVVTRGTGTIAWSAGIRDLAKGGYCFLPCSAGSVLVEAGETLELIECLPPLAAAGPTASRVPLP
ncbi:MAG: class I mannose-6-phosphate isomerase [Spirochaetia bacterium]